MSTTRRPSHVPTTAPAAALPAPSAAPLPHRLLGWPEAIAERGPDASQRRPVGGSQPARRRPTARPHRHTWPLAALLLLVGTLLLLAAGVARAADDPPGRVGRIAWIEGDADLERADGGDPLRHSRESLRNWPVTEGDRLFLAADSRAELDIGSTRLRLGAGTELTLKRLDDEAIEIDLQRGSLAVLLRSDEVARELAIDTPAGRLLPLGSGLYRADVPGNADSGSPSATAWRAGLEIAQPTGRYTLQPGQRAELYTDGGLRFTTPVADAFARWAMNTDELRAPQTAQDSPVPEEMTGADQLDRHGDWTRSPEDGWVWFPRGVVVGWAPYRHGRWSWVAPWGWTWIDDAPWGFAPFHYGRWVWWRDRWGWVPGDRVRRPVYAPALVVWNGRPGVSWSVTIGSGLAWYPLGPREVYVPPYRAGPRYLTGLNRPHVHDGALLGRAIERPDDVLRGTPYRYRGFAGAISTVGPREGRDGRDGRNDHDGRQGWRAAPWRGGTERLAPSLRAPEAPPAAPRLAPPRAPDATRGPVGRDERSRNAGGRDERTPPAPAPDRPDVRPGERNDPRGDRGDRADRPAGDPRGLPRNERGADRSTDRPNDRPNDRVVDRNIDRNGDGVPDRPAAPTPAQRLAEPDGRGAPAPNPVARPPAAPTGGEPLPAVPRSTAPQAPTQPPTQPTTPGGPTPRGGPRDAAPDGPREGPRDTPRDANRDAQRDTQRDIQRDGRNPGRPEVERRAAEPAMAPERPRPPAAPAAPVAQPAPAPIAPPAMQPAAPPPPRPEPRMEPRQEPRPEPRIEPRQESRPAPQRIEPPRPEAPRPEMRPEPRREAPPQRPDNRCDAGDGRCDNRGGGDRGGNRPDGRRER